jgi:hypothetical protein
MKIRKIITILFLQLFWVGNAQKKINDSAEIEPIIITQFPPNNRVFQDSVTLAQKIEKGCGTIISRYAFEKDIPIGYDQFKETFKNKSKIPLNFKGLINYKMKFSVNNEGDITDVKILPANAKLKKYALSAIKNINTKWTIPENYDYSKKPYYFELSFSSLVDMHIPNSPNVKFKIPPNLKEKTYYYNVIFSIDNERKITDIKVSTTPFDAELKKNIISAVKKIKTKFYVPENYDYSKEPYYYKIYNDFDKDDVVNLADIGIPYFPNGGDVGFKKIFKHKLKLPSSFKGKTYGYTIYFSINNEGAITDIRVYISPAYSQFKFENETAKAEFEKRMISAIKRIKTKWILPKDYDYSKKPYIFTASGLLKLD